MTPSSRAGAAVLQTPATLRQCYKEVNAKPTRLRDLKLLKSSINYDCNNNNINFIQTLIKEEGHNDTGDTLNNIINNVDSQPNNNLPNVNLSNIKNLSKQNTNNYTNADESHNSTKSSSWCEEEEASLLRPLVESSNNPLKKQILKKFSSSTAKDSEWKSNMAMGSDSDLVKLENKNADNEPGPHHFYFHLKFLTDSFAQQEAEVTRLKADNEELKRKVAALSK